MSYNRYEVFKTNGINEFFPFIKLPLKASDKTEIYVLGITRLDILSEKYYKNANYDWLILSANPGLSSLEFKIEDGVEITIPFPLETSLKDYTNEVIKHTKYY